MIRKLPYTKEGKSSMPESTKDLIEAGVMKKPRQEGLSFKYTTRVEIVFNLDAGPETFKKWSPTILLAIVEECKRYQKTNPGCLFAGRVDVVVNKVKKGSMDRKWGIHTNNDPETLAFGPGYDVPEFSFQKAFDEIEDIPKQYNTNKRYPYRVKKIIIMAYKSTRKIPG